MCVRRCLEYEGVFNCFLFVSSINKININENISKSNFLYNELSIYNFSIYVPVFVNVHVVYVFFAKCKFVNTYVTDELKFNV